MNKLKSVVKFGFSNVIVRGPGCRRIHLRKIGPSIALVLSGVASFVAAVPAQLIPSADGKTVYDAHLQARWLANANLAGTPEGVSIASQAGIPTAR